MPEVPIEIDFQFRPASSPFGLVPGAQKAAPAKGLSSRYSPFFQKKSVFFFKKAAPAKGLSSRYRKRKDEKRGQRQKKKDKGLSSRYRKGQMKKGAKNKRKTRDSLAGIEKVR